MEITKMSNNWFKEKHMVPSLRKTINDQSNMKEAKHWHTHKSSNSMLNKEISHKGIHVIWCHLHEISRINKYIETEK